MPSPLLDSQFLQSRSCPFRFEQFLSASKKPQSTQKGKKTSTWRSARASDSKLSRPENEKYVSGYDAPILEYQMSRTAQKQAAFVLPVLKPGDSVLDCGCGPGSISLGLATRVGPKGRLVGIDIEEKVIRLAQESAGEAGLADVASFQQESIYSLPFETGTFDVAFAHAVIQHLSEPSQAVAEMVRVVRPGGVIALHAPDWGGFLYHPRSTGVKSAVEYYMRLQVEKGGDPFAGRKLKALLRGAGLQDLDLRLSFDMDDPAAAARFFTAKIEQSVAEGAVEKGWTTAEEVREMIWAVQNELGADPVAVWATTRCEILGRVEG